MRPFSPEYQAHLADLQKDYECSTADKFMLPIALEGFQLRDTCLDEAYRLGVHTKEGRALLSTARDAAMWALKAWSSLGFGKADAEAPRRPGRPGGAEWSPLRRQGAQAVRGHLGGA
jgi:hypothetical protein